MDDIEAALDWVIENAATFNVAIVNISLGYGEVDHEVVTSLNDKFVTLRKITVISAVAAGNGGPNNTTDDITDLAANSNVIEVGALTADNQAAEFPQKARLLDVYAQGEDVAVDMSKLYRGEMAVDGTSLVPRRLRQLSLLLKKWAWSIGVAK